MAIVADEYDYVVGVDTHARTHTYTVVCSRTGAAIATDTFPTSRAGIARALTWIDRRTEGSVFAAVEGTSSYGAQVAAALTSHGITVGEVRPPARGARSQNGKSDPIDAQAAARSVLGREATSVPRPRSDGDRAALRVLLSARILIDQQRTANRNALTALLRTTDLGVDARRPLRDAQITTIAAWRAVHSAPVAVAVARMEAKRLATAVLDQTRQLETNRALLSELAEQQAPGLQATPGVGPVTAAIIICAYSHRGRVRSEAAFAALGGVAPLPASSGNTTRHRLSRTGDRQLNRAFDVIVRTRMSFDRTTREYVSRTIARGKTQREARRLLKRYVARAIFRQLQAAMP